MRRTRRAATTTHDRAQTGADAGAADAADETRESGPFRRCLITRLRQPKERMFRFVLGPDRVVVPDLLARLPGRGMWLSARADVLEPARMRGAFARAARGPVVVPPGMTELLRTGLERRIGELLGLARRAGQAVAGFDKAREWAASGRVGLVVQASDGSPEERRRFLSGMDGVTAVAPLSAAVLGAVFGRERVVHVAVAPGAFAATLVNEAGRLSGLIGPEREDERAGMARQAG